MTNIFLKRGVQGSLPTLQLGEPGFTTDEGRFYIGGSSGNVEIGGSSVSVGGANTHIQFNNNGTLSGTSILTYIPGTSTLAHIGPTIFSRKVTVSGTQNEVSLELAGTSNVAMGTDILRVVDYVDSGMKILGVSLSGLDINTDGLENLNFVFNGYNYPELVYMDGANDSVIVGGSNITGLFAVKGLEDEVQATFQAHTTQTSNILQVQNSASTVMMSISGTGATTFKNSSNSTTAFQVQQADATVVFNVDTTNALVGIGTASPGARLHIVGNADDQQLIVKANATQTANLVEFQNSSSTVLSGVDERGVLFCDLNTVLTNVFIGNDAGNATMSGGGNIAIGSAAGQDITSGTDNLCMGTNAGREITQGHRNVALGGSALRNLTTGSDNFAVGVLALREITTQSSNTALGRDALRYGPTQTSCTGIGASAGKRLDGANSVYIGDSCGGNAHASTQTGLNLNTAIGARALFYIETNSANNTAIGYNAGGSLTTGTSNIFIGQSSGFRQTTNSNLLVLDNQDRSTAAGESTDAIIYGVMAATPGSQTLNVNAKLLLEADSRALVFGAGQDATIQYDGTNLLVDPKAVGSGYVEVQGGLVFTDSATGLPHAEIYANDVDLEHTISSSGQANKVQVTAFSANGVSYNMTPDHTNDHITVVKAGMYLCNVSMTMESVAGSAAEFGYAVYKNNGATEFANLHGHRDLSAGGGQAGSISMSGIIDLAVNDTIEVWVWNETNTQNFKIDDISLSLVMIAGT